jgi:Zn-dependent M28 family amino/carboxypeptidase
VATREIRRGRLAGVVATLPGSNSTGSVFVVAHYDSTFGTPGAADDKASVAAMLETARALASAEPLRNDVVMIFTDGEEAGLLGASSFVAEHPLADRGGVVLNWEATGNAGPSVMFESSSGNTELIKELAASARYSVGDSALAALYCHIVEAGQCDHRSRRSSGRNGDCRCRRPTASRRLTELSRHRRRAYMAIRAALL